MVRRFTMKKFLVCLMILALANQAKAQYGGQIIGAIRNGNILAGGSYTPYHGQNLNIIRNSGGIDPASAIVAGLSTAGAIRAYSGGGGGYGSYPTYPPRYSYGSPYGSAYTGSRAPSDLGLPGEALYSQLGYVRVNTGIPTPTPSSLGYGLPGEAIYEKLGYVNGQGGYVRRPINHGNVVPIQQYTAPTRHYHR